MKLGSRGLKTAATTVDSIELAHRIRKGRHALGVWTSGRQWTSCSLEGRACSLQSRADIGRSLDGAESCTSSFSSLQGHAELR